MQETTDARTRFVKVYENVKIDVSDVKIMIFFFIISENEYFLILERSYERKVCLCSRNLIDETCMMKIIDDSGLKMKFAVTLAEHFSNKDVLNIFFTLTKDSLNE